MLARVAIRGDAEVGSDNPAALVGQLCHDGRTDQAECPGDENTIGGHRKPPAICIFLDTCLYLMPEGSELTSPGQGATKLRTPLYAALFAAQTRFPQGVVGSACDFLHWTSV